MQGFFKTASGRQLRRFVHRESPTTTLATEMPLPWHSAAQLDIQKAA